VTAPRHGDVSEATAAEQDDALRVWLAEVHDRVAAAAPPRGLRRQVSLPLRAARRFRTLVSDVGFRQAVVVAAEYAGRRLGWPR
jgi:hypothetical protein